MSEQHDHLSLAIKLAFGNVQQRGGRLFGAGLVNGGQVLSTGANEILSTHDPVRLLDKDLYEPGAKCSRLRIADLLPSCSAAQKAHDSWASGRDGW